MKKILIFTALLLAVANWGYSQMGYGLENDTKALEGVWIAKKGNKSYKIEFTRERFVQAKYDFEYIAGTLSFFENGKLKRTVPAKDFDSGVNAVHSDKNELYGIYTDQEERCAGNFKFKITKGNNIAKWELKPITIYRGLSDSYIPNRYEDYNKNGLNMPTKLTFKKQE